MPDGVSRLAAALPDPGSLLVVGTVAVPGKTVVAGTGAEPVDAPVDAPVVAGVVSSDGEATLGVPAVGFDARVGSPVVPLIGSRFIWGGDEWLDHQATPPAASARHATPTITRVRERLAKLSCDRVLGSLEAANPDCAVCLETPSFDLISSLLSMPTGRGAAARPWSVGSTEYSRAVATAAASIGTVLSMS